MIVSTKKTPIEILKAIAGFTAALTGSGPDQGNLARSVHLAVGVQALSDIKENFITLSRGGAGVDGTTWPPLTKEYLAYQRRFGPGEKASLKAAAGLGRANRLGTNGNKGLLTAAQLKRWQSIFGATFRRLSMSMGSEKEAKAKAAAIAWKVLKREGAKTFLMVYGSRKVDINRDTGVLLNSLSPGVFDGQEYTKPSNPGGSEQIMRPIDGGVVVGTNVAYAKNVHKRRPLWPAESPDVWNERRAGVGAQAMVIALRLTVERAA